MSNGLQVREQQHITNYSGVSSDTALINLWISSKGSEQTRTAYKQSIQDFFSYVGVTALSAITANDIESYKQNLADNSYSNSTIRLRLAAIKSLLNYASRTGYIQYNVGVVVTKPKASNTLAERILDESEVMELLKAAKAYKTKVMVNTKNQR